MMKSNSPRHASAARILLSARRGTPESIEPSDDLCAQILYILKLSAILGAFGQTKRPGRGGENRNDWIHDRALSAHRRCARDVRGPGIRVGRLGRPATIRDGPGS